MIDLDSLNMNSARSAFALANVPMYIARRLKVDPTTIQLANEADADELKDGYLRATASEPETYRDLVIPFALICALALKQDSEALLEVRDRDVTAFRWLREVVEGLIDQLATETNVVSLRNESGIVGVRPGSFTSHQAKSTSKTKSVKIKQ